MARRIFTRAFIEMILPDSRSAAVSVKTPNGYRWFTPVCTAGILTSVCEASAESRRAMAASLPPGERSGCVKAEVKDAIIPGSPRVKCGLCRKNEAKHSSRRVGNRQPRAAAAKAAGAAGLRLARFLLGIQRPRPNGGAGRRLVDLSAGLQWGWLQGGHLVQRSCAAELESRCRQLQ